MTGTEIANYDEKWAQQAQQYAEQEKLTGGTFISTRGGALSVGDEQMPGNQMVVVVLDVVNENTLYENTLTGAPYDPNDPVPPLCYAFGRSAEEMAPHESMQVDLEYFQPQAEACQGCKHNQWGSARTGRGKMCQNRRRLALIPAGYFAPKRGSRDFDLHLFDDPKHFQSADVAFLKLAPTSVEDWSKFVNMLLANHQRPPHGVFTRVWIETETRPNKRNQHRTLFEVIEEVPNELAAVIMARHEQALGQTIQGYQVPEERPAPAPVANSLRGMRRTR